MDIVRLQPLDIPSWLVAMMTHIILVSVPRIRSVRWSREPFAAGFSPRDAPFDFKKDVREKELGESSAFFSLLDGSSFANCNRYTTGPLDNLASHLITVESLNSMKNLRAQNLAKGIKAGLSHSYFTELYDCLRTAVYGVPGSSVVQISDLVDELAKQINIPSNNG